MTEQAPGIGHNLPPIEEIRQRTDDLIKTADEWLANVKEIGDDDQAGKASDFLDQLRAEYKAAETERKTEKQPHMDAAKAVDTAYKPITVRLETAAEAIKRLLTPWLQKKQRAEEEARRRREEEARQAEAEARAKAEEAAKANSIDAQIEAEEAAKRAEAAQKEADKIENARVKGEFGRTTKLHTTYRGEIEDRTKALAAYADDPLIIDALRKAINRDIRAGKRVISGVRIVQEQKAV